MNKRLRPHDEIDASAEKFALGAIMRHHGFRLQDAPLLDAVFADTLHAFCATTVARADFGEGLSVAALMLDHMDKHAARLEAEGGALALERRRVTYLTDREVWLASEHNDPAATWRRRVITKAQRFLIADMCRTLRCEAPLLTNRGEAADWLEQNGAHPVLRQDHE